MEINIMSYEEIKGREYEQEKEADLDNSEVEDKNSKKEDVGNKDIAIDNNENKSDKVVEKKSNFMKELRSYIIIIVAAVLVAIFVNNFILSNTRVPTGSMENTIMCGNRLFGTSV